MASPPNIEDTVVQHYFTAVSNAVVFFLDEQEYLQQANAILCMLLQLKITTNRSLLSAGSVALFLELAKLYSSDWQGGSMPGKRSNIERNREAAFHSLMEDYFSASPTYSQVTFRRRFRMSQHLFHHVVDGVVEADTYFQQKPDATQRMGAHPIQKVTAALRMLAYGASADQLDEWIRLGESTVLEALKRFIAAVNKSFGKEYLRAPNKEDTLRLLKQNLERGFPGCIGSIDCWHWSWKNCPTAWKGHYSGKKGTGCVTEACCSKDLWIWHLFVGNPGSLNDLNILDRSPLLQQLFYNTAPKVNFEVNGHVYNTPYWLADGIYPRRNTFVLAYAKPVCEIDRNFTHWQESVRKDIERAFGVLQARWRILSAPARHWDRNLLDNMIKCCVILHNMIIEDEYNDNVIDEDVQFDEYDGTIVSPTARITVEDSIMDPAESVFATVLQRVADHENEQVHFQLRDDLKTHLYNNHPHYSKDF